MRNVALAAVVLAALIYMDDRLNAGQYTRGITSMAREISTSFGWR